MRSLGALSVLLLVACAGEAEPEPTTPPPPPPTAGSGGGETAPVIPETAEPAPPPEPEPAPDPWRDLGEAPWSAPPLAATKAPGPLRAAWRAAPNRESCAALAFEAISTDTVAPELAGARPRRATFVGGWSVAYDKRGLAGSDSGGAPCTDCGRGVIGIAGTGSPADLPARDGEWAGLGRWSDGSRVAYGPEGGTTGPNQLAYLTVEGLGCLYNVWSWLGQEHLEFLLTQIRRVEGMP
jgi:hypothetical protein